MELFASAPGLAVEESYVRLLNHLPGLAYRCRVGRTDPIVSERLEYTLEFVSKGSYDLLGIPAEDMVRNNNNTIERMMHPDDLQKTRRNMYDSIVAHQPYQVMYRVSLPSGRLKWIWDQGEGVFDADGELRYLEGLMMDISEQKFQELELKEENRQLKASVSNLYGLGNIVGKSEAMRRVYGLILKLFNVVIDKFAADLLKVISLFLQPLLIVYRTSIDVFHNKYMDSRILLI